MILFLFVQIIKLGAFGHVPNIEELKDIQNANTSQVISSDNKVLGKYYEQNRTNIDFKDIPKNVIDALVATEDARFFTHGGVDIRSLFRVFFKTILLQKSSSGGGSTLSQQLVKNLYGRKRHLFATMLINKIKEMIVAKRLESLYTKDELLTLYLNTVPFSGNVYGVKVASNAYFGKNPSKLKIEEAAVLIGMLKANTTYDPLLHPEKSKTRRNVVLSQMHNYGVIDKVALDSLKKTPLVITKKTKTSADQLTSYYVQHIRSQIEDILSLYEEDYGEVYNLNTDGLKIYTTIDSRLQKYAERSVEEHLTYLQKLLDKQKPLKMLKDNNPMVIRAMKDSHRYRSLVEKGKSKKEIKTIFNKKVSMAIFKWGSAKEKVEMSPMDSIKYYLAFLNTGFMAADPHTGHIKAWVGGVNFNKMPYDHVLSKRQTGSIFKPFVYATALEDSMEVCTYIPNLLTTYTEYDDWQPRNSNGKYGGYYSLQGGITHSVNTIAVDLIMQLEIDSVIALTHRLGIDSELPQYPSIALGTADISVGEMVKAYIPFANNGVRHELSSVVKIETAEGKILYEKEEDIEGVVVISEKTSKTMTHLLKSVVNNGTAKRLRTLYKFTDEIAGKTGTTQSHADGWFMGYTSDLVAGCWVGSASPSVHFNTITYGQGAVMALPIWARFFQKIKADRNLKKYHNSHFESFTDEELSLMDCELFVEELPIRDTIGVDTLNQNPSLNNLINFFKKDKKDDSSLPKTKKKKKKSKYETRKEKKKRKRKEKRKKFWRRILGG